MLGDGTLFPLDAMPEWPSVERQVGKVVYIDLPTPPMGGKIWVLEKKGVFVLEPGPGTLRTIACTHAGSGAIDVLDGIPDDNGFFADEEMTDPSGRQADFATPDDYTAAIRSWHSRRGRRIYPANPVVMGSWMLDGGFIHGLTIRAEGGAASACAMASIVWMPYRARPKPPS